MTRGRKPGETEANTKEWQEGFLAALRECPNVLRAAKAVKIARALAYRYRESDPEFAAKWDAALQEGKDNMVEAVESLTYDLAANSRSFRHNTLRMFWLKSHKPEVYGDKSEVKLKGSRSEPLHHTHDLTGLGDEDIETLYGIIKKTNRDEDADS